MSISRYPTTRTLLWTSRTNREMHTFPPRRLRLLFCPKGKQRPKPKPKRRRPKGRIALFHKADRSRINKTGQLDLLTTVGLSRGFWPGILGGPGGPSGDRRQFRRTHGTGGPPGARS